MVDDIACDETLLAELLCCDVASQAMEVYSQFACFILLVTSC